jgi:DNA-directed RNA polymerase subunit L
MRMKVNVIKKTDTELKIELVGATHGICTLLAKRLLEDKTVEFAGYDVAHPLAASPIIYMRTKGAEKPMDALIRAVQQAEESNAAFGKALEKTLKA